MAVQILRLIGGRILLSLLTLLLVSIIIFAIIEVLPGDVATRILGRDATPATLATLREKLHLNDPGARALSALARRHRARRFRHRAHQLPADLRSSGAALVQHPAAVAGRLPDLHAAVAHSRRDPGGAPRPPDRPWRSRRSRWSSCRSRISCWGPSCCSFVACDARCCRRSRWSTTPRPSRSICTPRPAGHDPGHRHGRRRRAHAARQPDRGARLRLCPHGRAEGPAAAARCCCATRCPMRSSRRSTSPRSISSTSSAAWSSSRRSSPFRASAACWSTRCSCATVPLIEATVLIAAAIYIVANLARRRRRPSCSIRGCGAA